MTREQLEHVLRVSAALTSRNDFVVIGSQALLASYPAAPDDLLRSMEVDLYPLHAPELADLLDGSIGELSPFHETYGYYAHGVGPETARLPSQWRDRLVRIETVGCVGWCLAIADLAVSKLLAGRARDFEFVRALLRERLTASAEIDALASELDASLASLLRERLAIAARPSGPALP